MKLSNTNKKLFGVCGGIAEKFGIDAALVRIGFVVGSLFTGIPIVVYIVLALTMEKA